MAALPEPPVGYSLGFWIEPAQAGRPSFEPDPRQLVVAWDRDEQANVVAYLRAGHMAAVSGTARRCCFGCPGGNGSQWLWDGVFLWPEGLAHYIAEHSVGLPDDFLRHVATNGYVVPPAKVFGFEDTPPRKAFRRWAISRTPPPAPRAGTLSLEEAQTRAAELSIERASFRIEPFQGHWHIVAGFTDGYIEPLLRDELDRILMNAREAYEPVTLQEATFDLDRRFTITESASAEGTVWRIAHARRTVEIAQPDRKSWHLSLRWEILRAAEAVLMTAREAEAELRKDEPSVSIVEADGDWNIQSARAEGRTKPFGEGYLRHIGVDLKHAHDPRHAAKSLEVLRRR
jgi:hypothetical protein